MTAQGLEKWLKAAVHKAAQNSTVDSDVAHPGGTPDLSGRRSSDETDLHSLDGQLARHAPEPRGQAER